MGLCGLGTSGFNYCQEKCMLRNVCFVQIATISRIRYVEQNWSAAWSQGELDPSRLSKNQPKQAKPQLTHLS